MARTAPRIHLDQATINRLKELQRGLDAEMRVELHMHDGSVLVGVLPERPTVQQFLDAQDNEGTNGQLRLDTGDGGFHLVWLDEIDSFTRLGTN